MKKIPFSPPDITEREINEVCEVLRSGWITTGPRVAKFEDKLREYCECDEVVTVNSATAAMELILKIYDIKEGDEIITTPYTYTATASVCLHRGVKPVFVDVEENSFVIDIEKIKEKITENTKVIMPVDIGGFPVDYDRLRDLLKGMAREDIIIICDSAHSIGAKYKGKPVGSQCDFHTFSFHAVKNLTTGEGGAITFHRKKDREDLFREMKVTSLHGQTKDALSKMQAGAWEYDIVTDGHKSNMTDMNAAIGLVQLERYDDMLKKRKRIFEIYNNILKDNEKCILPISKIDDGTESSYHLYLLRIEGYEERDRNELIKRLAEEGIATNVHYKPLPMLTLYKNLGYDMKNYTNAYNQYKNEITLPVYSTLSEEDAEFIARKVKELI